MARNHTKIPTNLVFKLTFLYSENFEQNNDPTLEMCDEQPNVSMRSYIRQALSTYIGLIMT